MSIKIEFYNILESIYLKGKCVWNQDAIKNLLVSLAFLIIYT